MGYYNNNSNREQIPAALPALQQFINQMGQVKNEKKNINKGPMKKENTYNTIESTTKDLNPILLHDSQFTNDSDRLNKSFQCKLNNMRAVYELTKQQLIAKAKLRNSIPKDIWSLMKRAKEIGNVKNLC